MKFGPPFSDRRLKPLCVAALLVAACGNQAEVRRANDAYQQALALNDIGAQRRALMALTKADDGVSEYWIQLAKLDLQVGAFGDAYAHFSRAHELDRTAVMPLSMMTELAVINGRVDLAEELMKKLTVIAPSDRAVSVARGFTALRQGDYAKAQENVDVLLAQGPRDSVANVLQARIFVAQKNFPEAIEFLKGKLMFNANDRGMLRSLAAIQRYLANWAEAAEADFKMWRQSPSDALLAERVVGEALQAKNHALANRVAERVMADAKTLEEVAGVLTTWAEHAPRGQVLSATDRASLPEHSKIALAHYFNRIGEPDQALSLLGSGPRPASGRSNVDFNAAFAESLFLNGQSQPALQILNRILDAEPDHAAALSARARLLSRNGAHRAATADAQRLVTSYDTVADYRVLLAQIYRANRDARWAERTLWDGYRDLPGNDQLYRQLQAMLVGRGDKDGLSRLKNDHDQERYSRLMKELA